MSGCFDAESMLWLSDEFPISRLYGGARYGTLRDGATEAAEEVVGRET
jgi:hypothetical protein